MSDHQQQHQGAASEAALIEAAIRDEVERARADPGGYLIEACWRLITGMQVHLAAQGINVSGEMILQALATLSAWAINDVPDAGFRARYLNQFEGVVREAVEGRDLETAKKERNKLAQSGLN